MALLATLLSQSRFELRLLTRAAGRETVFDWASSSDLLDPTPFLQAEQMLLTTGTQFADDATAETYRAYVERLVGHDVRALGFGTEVVRAGTPPELVAACETLALPLIEVPYRTPFIALIRWAADENAAARRSRDVWTVQAQRAVSAAALTREGAAGALRALAKQTGLAAISFDAHGTAIDRIGAVAEISDRLAAEVATLLHRGGRSSATVHDGDTAVTIQTLGRPGHGRGALALIGDQIDDRAVRTVVAGTIALIEMSMRTHADIAAAAAAIGAGFVGLVLDGHERAARSFARTARRGVPSDPIRVLSLTGPPSGLGALRDELMSRHGDEWAMLRRSELVVLCADESAERLIRTASRISGIHIGVSGPSPFLQTRDALIEARRSREAATRRDERIGRAGSGPEASLRLVVDADAAKRIAARKLDVRDGVRRRHEARIWLEHNGSFDPAAKELGTHRHRLRARIDLLAEETGLDLTTFAGRAELWLLVTSYVENEGARAESEA